MAHASNRFFNLWGFVGLVFLLVSPQVRAQTAASVTVVVNYSNWTTSQKLGVVWREGGNYLCAVWPGLSGSGTATATFTLNTGNNIAAVDEWNITTTYTANQLVTGTATYTFYISGTGGGGQLPPPTQQYYTVVYTNTTPFDNIYSVKRTDNGVLLGTSPVVPPGGSGTFVVPGPTDGSEPALTISAADPGGHQLLNPYSVPANASGWGTSSSGGTPGAAITASYGATGPIEKDLGPVPILTWTDGTAPALDTTMKTGFSDLSALESQAFDSIEGELASLQSEAAQINGTAGALQTPLNNTASSSASTAAGVATLQSELTALDIDVKAMATKEDTANGTLSTMASTEAAMNTALGTLNSGMSTLDNDLKTQLGTLNTTANGLAKDATLVGVNSTIQGVRSDLNTLDSDLKLKVGQVDSDVQLVQGAVNNLGGKLDTLHSDNGQVETALTTANGSLSSAVTLLTSIQNQQTAGNNQAHTDASAINSSVASVTAEVNNYGTQTISALSAIQSAIAADTASTGGKLDQVNVNLGTANGWLQGIKADVDHLPAMDTTLGQVKGDLDGVTNSLGDLQQTAHYIKADGDMTTNELGQIYGGVTNLPAATYAYSVQQLALQSFDSNVAMASGSAAAAGFTNSVGTAAQSLSDAAATVDTSGDMDSTFWTTSLPIIGSVITFDFNPLHSELLSPLIGAIYTSILWVVTYLYVFACFKVAEDKLNYLTPYQARTAGTSVMGTNTNALSALGMAGMISLALAAIPAVFVAWLASPAGSYAFSLLLTNPVNAVMGASPAARQGLLLLCHFIPIQVIITDALLYLAYRFGFAGYQWTARQIMLYLVGL